jgi:Mn-dependent DtxR family transcriptional regulator
MNRLHDKGYIADPRSKAKSVVLTKKGRERAEELFWKLFGEESPPDES